MNNRIHSIDALRGFSILGILLVNMFSFQYNADFIEYFEQFPSINMGIVHGLEIAVKASFYPLFAFLFGYSIMLFVRSAQLKQRNYIPSFIRRGLALIVLGTLHYIFIWKGDILAPYGLLTLGLLLFIKTSSKVKLILVFVFGLFAVATNTITRLFKGDSQMLLLNERTNEALMNGSYIDILQERLLFNMSEHTGPAIVNAFNYVFTVALTPIVLLPLALYGMYKAQKAIEHQTTLSERNSWPGLVLILIGLALKSTYLWLGGISSVCYAIGAFVLTIGYIKFFVWLYDQVFANKVQLFFERIGKMSLSNYLFQSIVATTIFYSYGLGYFGQLGTVGGLLIALTIFAVQGVISYFYFNKFTQGPVEYIVRLWTNFGKKDNKHDQPSNQSLPS